ncbi:MAG: hypothetical protein EP343_02060 [Deltaproteobacteria bacterium]|nr:MAG: hypothetical protein EP343_02060 [Deltaproteobacteria bacterium]
MEQIIQQWNDLPRAAKFLIVVLIWGAMFGGYYFMYYEDQQRRYRVYYNQFRDARKQRDKLRTILFNISRWQAEIARLDGELAKATTLLPTSKELPTLLRRIDNLGRKSGLEILRFRPGREKPKQFYSEVPIRIGVKGTFYELMIFLNKVSNLDRIVTIQSVSLTNPTFKNQKLLLGAKFQLVTYRYRSRDSKKKRRRRRR